MDEIDRRGVIFALTEGIGPKLGGPIRFAFFELLSRLESSERFVKEDLAVRQDLVDILALSVFYTQVVSPLESGRYLMSLAKKAEADHVRIGKDRLTTQFSHRIGWCVRQFRAMMESQRIPRDVLSFSRLDRFIQKCLIARGIARS